MCLNDLYSHNNAGKNPDSDSILSSKKYAIYIFEYIYIYTYKYTTTTIFSKSQNINV